MNYSSTIPSLERSSNFLTFQGVITGPIFLSPLYRLLLTVVFAIEARPTSDDEIELSIHCIKRGSQDWDFFYFDEEKFSPSSPIRNTPILFDGEFYCVGYDGALGNFDLNDGYNWEVLEEARQQFKDSYPTFLAECGGDLLLVKLGCSEMPVRIFRLDFAKRKWVKVESLGKHMLFIYDISCFSAIAPNSRMANKSRDFAKNFCGTKGWLRNYTWIEPNWSKSTPQELDWFKLPSLP
ncbi:uncharacterized protein LOC113284403 isoform X2 [Papaver somniferum]|uniref:uncharacterized protein LOC113284403 isoform X2 n=1 Tax=Papaver somniferum TaxID=3469 RepID=UPI000E7021FE|nr:uncharacterized protein LOC113284403 isoform X2 [Papaver somniferum]